jgi:predicted RNA-binding Zn-ribbon protein involved in translation (DUF1610 family)
MVLGDDDAMSGESAAAPGPAITERDIVFDCHRCGGELVVDRDGEGMEVPCPHCGQVVVIPAYRARLEVELTDAPAVAPAAVQHRFDFTGFSADQLGRRMEELRHQLKENRSQMTEMRGHVGRATIELHRLQLRLQKLQDRQIEIEAEMSVGLQYLPQA